MRVFDVAFDQKEEAKKFRDLSRKMHMVFSHPDGFECLVEILTILKWRGKLGTVADMERHNAAEEIMALFGENGPGWDRARLESVVHAAIGG